MAIDSKWVRLSAQPGIQIELIATDIPGVFKTDEIKVTLKGQLIDSYNHVRVYEINNTLVLYDIKNNRDCATLGHFIAIN